MSTMRTTSSIAWGKILPTTKVKYRCSQKNLNFCVSTIAIDHFEGTTLFLCSTNNNTTSVQFILLQIKTSTELHEQQESKVNTTTLVRPNSSLGPTLLYPSHVRSKVQVWTSNISMQVFVHSLRANLDKLQLF